MLIGMYRAWRHLEENDELMCAILTGAGGTFCSGMDLKKGTKTTKEYGLINRIAPKGEALNEAKRVAEELCKNGPLSIKALTKSLREYAEAAMIMKMDGWRDYCVKWGRLGISYSDKVKAIEPKRVEAYYWQAQCIGKHRCVKFYLCRPTLLSWLHHSLQ